MRGLQVKPTSSYQDWRLTALFTRFFLEHGQEAAAERERLAELQRQQLAKEREKERFLNEHHYHE